MGLDMYLTKKIYLSQYSKEQKSLAEKVSVLVECSEPAKEVVVDCGYWRKANAIHNWFVREVQDGKDDCNSYWVSTEKMEELLEAVNAVLEGSKLIAGKIQNGQHLVDGEWKPILVEGEYIKNTEIAEDLLPAVSGFFFGSTNYDEYYIADLRSTKEILEREIPWAKAHPDWVYEYQSSW